MRNESFEFGFHGRMPLRMFESFLICGGFNLSADRVKQIQKKAGLEVAGLMASNHVMMFGFRKGLRSCGWA